MSTDRYRRDDPAAPPLGYTPYKRSPIVAKATAWRALGVGLALGGLIVLLNTLHNASANTMYFTAGLLLVVGIFILAFAKNFK